MVEAVVCLSRGWKFNPFIFETMSTSSGYIYTLHPKKEAGKRLPFGLLNGGKPQRRLPERGEYVSTDHKNKRVKV